MSSDTAYATGQGRRCRRTNRTGWAAAGARLVLAAGSLMALPACDYDLGPAEAVVVSEPFAHQLDAAGHSGLQLWGVNGPVTVTDGGQDETVAVAGSRTVRGCSRSEAEEWIDRLEVRIDDSGEAIIVRTEQPHRTDRCSLAVEYEVRVPRRFAAQVRNVNGPVRVTGLRGAADVANVNGNVGFHDLAAPVRVRLTNGNISGDAVLTGDGGVDLMTVNGNLELTIPTGSSAVLTASLSNGTIRVSNLVLSSQVLTRTTLTGILGSGEGEIRLQTTNGNITATGT